MAKKANEQIRRIENKLQAQAGRTTVPEFDLAMREVAKFAKIIAKNARMAILILKKMKPKVEAYRGNLRDAVG
jgi:hypothetical protein